MILHRTYNIDTQTMLQDEHGVNVGLVEVSAVDEIAQAVNSYEADKKLIAELSKTLKQIMYYSMPGLGLKDKHNELCEKAGQLLKEVRDDTK